ncbi:MAG: tripartite tricarboxylate transporter TctB family protein [Pseudomonadota bacterium]
MRRYIESVVLTAIGALGIWGAWQVPAASSGDTWAGVVPFAAALALIALAGIMALSAARQPADGPVESTSGMLDILILFAVALLYQQSLRWFGYILPTAIAAPIVLYLFGVRNWIGLGLSVVLCPLVFHVIFFELLGVFPPFGLVFDLLFYLRG